MCKYRRIILTSNFLTSVSQSSRLPIFDSIYPPTSNSPPTQSTNPMRCQFELLFKKSLHTPFSPSTCHSLLDSRTELSATSNTTYHSHIKELLNEYPSITHYVQPTARVNIQHHSHIIYAIWHQSLLLSQWPSSPASLISPIYTQTTNSFSSLGKWEQNEKNKTS